MASKAAKFDVRAKDKTKAAFQSVKAGLDRMKQAANRVSSATKVMGTVISASLGLATRKIVESADQINQFSIRLGVSREELSKYQLVAARANVAFNEVLIALQRMTRRVSEASTGFGEAKGALKELRLDAVELTKLSPDQQFEAIAEQLSKIPSQADKVRLAFKLFDSGGVALLQTMENGAEGIRKTKKEAEGFGLVLTKQESTVLTRLRKTWVDLAAQFLGLAKDIVVTIAPAFELIAKVLSSIIKKFRQAVAAIKKFKDFMLGTAEAGEKLAETGKKVSFSMEKVVKGFPASKMIDDILLWDIGLAQVNERFAEMGSNKRLGELKAVFEEMEIQANNVRQVWESVASGTKQAMKGIIDGTKGPLEALRDLTKSVVNDILNQMLKIVLFGGSGTLGGGPNGSTGGIFGALLNAVPASLRFAQGGSFTVGGSGGTDSQFVGFRATPGERVSVTRPGQSGINVNIINNAGVQVQTSSSRNGNGQQDLTIQLDRINAQNIRNGGATLQAIQDMLGGRLQTVAR